MNSMKNIHTVARYEARLLRRSWLFRIFAGLAVVGIFLAVGNWCTPLFGGGMTRWNQVALSGQIPFFSTYLFHILQAVAVVFLAGGRMATGRKADTMDVLYARQAGNGDFVWGKVWGTLKVCGGVMAAGGGGVPARGSGEVAVFVVGILFLRADAGVAEPRVCAGAVAVGELRGERAGIGVAPAAGRDGDAVFLPERSGVRGVGCVRANRAHGGFGRDGHGRYGGLSPAAGHVPLGGHRAGFLDGGGVPEIAEPTWDGGRAVGRLGMLGAGCRDGLRGCKGKAG